MDEGRTARFRSLYDGTRPRIIAYAMRRTKSPKDAADAVAETYSIAWRRLDDVPRGDDAVLWLYVTARHVLSNETRSIRRRSHLIARIASDLPDSEEVALPCEEDRLVAVQCLRILSDDDRELLMLASWVGLSATEIAWVLACSPNAARIRLHRERRRLNEVLADALSETESEKQAGRVRHTEKSAAIRCIPEEA